MFSTGSTQHTNNRLTIIAHLRTRVHDTTLFIEIDFVLFSIAFHTVFRDIYIISYIWNVTVLLYEQGYVLT
jgi:hypothetical protein